MRKTTCRWLFLTFLLVAMSALIIQLSHLNFNTRTAVAERGMLTLSADSIADGFVLLDGQLLVRNGFNIADDAASPEWQYSRSLRTDINMANHTYSLLLTVKDENICFLMPQPLNCSVWINGINVTEKQLLAGKIVQLSDYDTEESGVYRIILQVGESTSLRVRYHGFMFGTQEQLTHVLIAWNTSTMIAVGIYVLLLVQCFALYFQKRSERYLLILMLVVLQAGLRGLLISLYPSSYIFYSGSGFDAIVGPFIRLTLPFNLLLLISIFPEDIGKKALACGLMISGAGAVCAAAGIVGFQPLARLSTHVELIMLMLEAGCILKSFLLDRPGSRVLLAGVTVYMAGRLFSQMITWGIVPSGIVDTYYYPWQYANLIYLISYVIAIDGKFARKFSEADVLSANLQQINADLEHIVAVRTANLEKANRDLAESNDALIQFQRKKQTFLGDVVHNLRTPLFTLGGAVEMLQEDLKELPRFSSRLRKMTEKIGFIQQMINELFLMVRMDDGRISFDLKQHALNALLLQSCSDFQSKGEQKGVEIRTILPQAPVLAAFDDFYLRQAIENILDNAIRHSSPDMPVTVSLEQDHDSVRIMINNEGDPISPADLPRIFERYYKGQESRPEQTGLGLSITREIISGHGGTVTVKSNAGGTCFTITLPAR